MPFQGDSTTNHHDRNSYGPTENTTLCLDYMRILSILEEDAH